MQIFFLAVALGLFTSTLSGIYMAYRYNRSKSLVTGLLFAGIAVPFVLLLF
jgi:ABC-type dipeptide/oligopeptide/nickel transport system permease component